MAVKASRPVAEGAPETLVRIAVPAPRDRCSTLVLRWILTMATTTIRLDPALKARLTKVAAHAGVTAHAFILEAIAASVSVAEEEESFHRVAERRWARVLATGKTIPWDEARAWLEARAQGLRPRRPTARKPRR